MNGFPPQPQAQSLTLEGMINIRLNLDQIRNPSKEIKDAIAKLDKMIATIIGTFQPVEIKQGPVQ